MESVKEDEGENVSPMNSPNPRIAALDIKNKLH